MWANKNKDFNDFHFIYFFQSLMGNENSLRVREVLRSKSKPYNDCGK